MHGRVPVPRHLAAGLLTIAAVAAIVGACSSAGSTPQVSPSIASVSPAMPSTEATSSVVHSPAPSPSGGQLQVVAVNGIGTDIERLDAGFGAAWAASSEGLLKVTATGTPDVVVPGPVLDIGIGAHAVYALADGGQTLVEVDPHSGKELRHWTFSTGAKSLAVTSAAAYVDFTFTPPTIDRIDLASGRIRTTTLASASGGRASGETLAVGDGLLWRTDGATVLGLDPVTLAVKRSGQLSSGVDDIWFGDGSLWAASWQQGVHRVDPATSSETGKVPSDAAQIAFSPHGVWVSSSNGPTELDPTTGAIVATLPDGSVIGADPFGIAVVGDEVWVAYKDEGQLQRIKVP